MEKQVAIGQIGKLVVTQGLTHYCEWELALEVGAFPIEGYKDLLRYIVDYIISTGKQINIDESFMYLSWLLKFKNCPMAGYLEIFEIDRDGRDLQKGAELTLSILHDQLAVCDRLNAQAVFTQFGQTVVVSDGVEQGEPVEGARYAFTDSTSGWFLTTNRYSGDISTLRVMHYYHIAFLRKDIVKYMALPPGCFFDTSDGYIGLNPNYIPGQLS